MHGCILLVSFTFSEDEQKVAIKTLAGIEITLIPLTVATYT